MLWLCAAALSGCVERTLQIETDPPGAELFVDFHSVGKAPVEVPFTHYGTRQVEARLDGHETLRKLVPLRPPWYQWFPLELVSECLWPGTIHDRRTVTLTLRPLVPDEAGLMERARRAGEIPK